MAPRNLRQIFANNLIAVTGTSNDHLMTPIRTKEQTNSILNTKKFIRLDLNDSNYSASFRMDVSNNLAMYVGAGSAADGSQINFAQVVKTTGDINFTGKVKTWSGQFYGGGETGYSLMAPGNVTDSSAFVARGSGSSYNPSGIEIFAGGLERVRVMPSGNVGFGTGTPNDRLHVTVTPALTGLTKYGFRATTAGTEYGARFLGYLDQGVGSGVIIETIDAGTTTERLRINTSGNMGLGGAPTTHRLASYGPVGSFITSGQTAFEIYNTSVNKAWAIYPNTNGSNSDLGFYSNSGTPGVRMYMQGASGNVGLGTSSPVSRLHVSGTADTTHLLINGPTKGIRFLTFSDRSSIEGVDQTGTGSYQPISVGGSSVLLSPTNGTVGVSTTTPAGRLHINTGGAASAWGAAWGNWATVIGGAGTTDGGLGFSYNDTEGGVIGAIVPGSAWKNITYMGLDHKFRINGSSTDTMTINGSTGYVGIGTSSPTHPLQIRKNAIGMLALNRDHATEKKMTISFQKQSTNLWEMGTDIGNTGNQDFYLFDNVAATTRLFVNSSGYLGVGTTNPTAKLEATASNGSVPTLMGRITDTTQYSGATLSLVGPSTTSTRLVHFNYNTGGTEGSFGIQKGDGNGNWTGAIAQFDFPTNHWIHYGATVRPGTDNNMTLGTASFRWGQIYSGIGTISTSDATLKATRDGKAIKKDNKVSAFTDSEIAAAKELSREIGVYKWQDSVTEKGEDARLHVGMTVQRAIEIMESHGLEPFSYGFICKDEITKKVIKKVKKKVQKTESKEETYTEIEIIDGIPTQVEKTRVTEVPVTKLVTIVNSNGDKILDEEGKVKKHPVPVMIEKTVEEEVDEPNGVRYGFRYDQLTLFILAGIQSI